MRLIDADSIQEELAVMILYLAGTPKGECIEYAHDLIDAQPTIDAVPAVHAHWEIENTAYARFARCPVCGIHIRIPTTGHKESERFYLYPDEMHYCPNCGARMDERKTNEYSGE